MKNQKDITYFDFRLGKKTSMSWESRLELAKKFKRLNRASMIFGVAGLFLVSVAKNERSVVAGLISDALFMVGLSCYAQIRGRRPAFGLLGLLSIIGLVILYFLPQHCLLCSAKQPFHAKQCEHCGTMLGVGGLRESPLSPSAQRDARQPSQESKSEEPVYALSASDQPLHREICQNITLLNRVTILLFPFRRHWLTGSLSVKRSSIRYCTGELFDSSAYIRVVYADAGPFYLLECDHCPFWLFHASYHRVLPQVLLMLLGKTALLFMEMLSLHDSSRHINSSTFTEALRCDEKNEQ